MSTLPDQLNWSAKQFIPCPKIGQGTEKYHSCNHVSRTVAGFLACTNNGKHLIQEGKLPTDCPYQHPKSYSLTNHH